MVRQICTIIFLSTLLWGQDYYLSYKFFSKDFIIYNEDISISKAMVDKGDTPQRYISFISTYKTPDALVKHEKAKLLELLLKQFAQTSSQTTVKGAIATVETSLEIYPKRIKVEINNGLAKIGLYD